MTTNNMEEAINNGIELRWSLYNSVVSNEAKIFFKNLFELNLTDEQLDGVQLTVGMILDTFSMFGVYPLVKPVTVNSEIKFSPDILSIKESQCPALLYYDENGYIHHTDFGTAKRFGYHQTNDKDKIDAGRLVSLRYWNLLEKTIEPKDRGLQKKIREVQTENRNIKKILEVCEEDYNVLKRFLRFSYPEIWQEFLDIDSPTVKKLLENG